MADPVTASILSKILPLAIPAVMSLGGNIMGSRAQDRATRSQAKQAAASQLTGALGNTQPSYGARPSDRSLLADTLKDDVTQQLLTQLLAGGGGQQGMIQKLMGLFGNANRVNQAAQGMGAPGVTGGLDLRGGGAGLNQGGGYNIKPSLLKGLGG